MAPTKTEKTTQVIVKEAQERCDFLPIAETKHLAANLNFQKSVGRKGIV
jgi:hypothetical protein